MILVGKNPWSNVYILSSCNVTSLKYDSLFVTDFSTELSINYGVLMVGSFCNCGVYLHLLQILLVGLEEVVSHLLAVCQVLGFYKIGRKIFGIFIHGFILIYEKCITVLFECTDRERIFSLTEFSNVTRQLFHCPNFKIVA